MANQRPRRILLIRFRKLFLSTPDRQYRLASKLFAFQFCLGQSAKHVGQDELPRPVFAGLPETELARARDQM